MPLLDDLRKQVAQAGIDHPRLPVDPTPEEEDRPSGVLASVKDLWRDWTKK